jgi:hypothetical protein
VGELVVHGNINNWRHSELQRAANALAAAYQFIQGVPVLRGGTIRASATTSRL